MSKSRAKLDKDLMFAKIMPALEDNPFVHTPSSVETLSNGDPDYSKLSALRDKLFARSGSPSQDGAVSTINVMENLVLQNLDTVIQKFNTCSCDRCRCDVAAYALNLLPAKYIVADPAKLDEVASQISQKLILDALIKAVIAVRAHPRH